MWLPILMVIIPVTREVSFHGSLFKATTLTLELFNVIIKPWDLWTINHSPCFKRRKPIQHVSKGLVKAVGERINVVPLYACTKHRRGNISWEHSRSIFLSLRKVIFFAWQSWSWETNRTLNNKMIGDGKSSFRGSKNNIIWGTSNN